MFKSNHNPLCVFCILSIELNIYTSLNKICIEDYLFSKKNNLLTLRSNYFHAWIGVFYCQIPGLTAMIPKWSSAPGRMCCWVRPTFLCTPKRSWNSCLLLSPLNQVLGLQTPQIWVTLQMTASLRKWTTTLHLISSHLWLKKQQWNPWSEDMIYMFYTQNTELSRGEGLIFGREWQKKEIWVTSLWVFFSSV